MLFKIFSFLNKVKYKKIIKRIQAKVGKERINVLFYVTENSKWSYQSLYDLLEKSSVFKPFIIVSILKDVHIGKDITRNNLEENYKFFKSRGMNVFYGYKNNKYINLKEFSPDIVFYEQPWGLPKILKPKFVSKFALTCYCPYALPLLEYRADYIKKFHAYLYKFFVDSFENIERFETYLKGSSYNCVRVGYIKLDEYFNEFNYSKETYWKEPEKFKIIYSPHHSFAKTSIKMATFKMNGQYILNLAKSLPNTTWIFKPHPQLKYALIKNGIMTEKEVEDYYKAWEDIGNVYLQGDYFDIFKSSDLMITDCCSFLAEYLPSGKPLIRLLNEKSAELNPLGKEVVKGYYQVSNNDELENIFNQLVFDKNDEKKEIRTNSQKYVIDFEQKCSDKILENILLEI